MSEPKDYRTILARYHFRDDHGHALEWCSDYRDLLAELERLRREAEPSEFSPAIEKQIEANLKPRN